MVMVRISTDVRLVFGPIAQTVAAMSCISLGKSYFSIRNRTTLVISQFPIFKHTCETYSYSWTMMLMCRDVSFRFTL